MMLNTFTRYSLAVIVAILMVSLLDTIQAQRQKVSGNKAVATTASPLEKTPYVPIPFLVQGPGIPTHQHGNPLIQQNSSLPFSVRFPRPERKSNRFHYPMLPSVYWTLHKRPEVPLVEPDLNDLGLGDYEE